MELLIDLSKKKTGKLKKKFKYDEVEKKSKNSGGWNLCPFILKS